LPVKLPTCVYPVSRQPGARKHRSGFPGDAENLYTVGLDSTAGAVSALPANEAADLADSPARGDMMKIGGISIILLLGMLNMVLILFQLSTGLRWIRVPLGVHKRTGMLLFVSALVHALLASLVS
jgi:hypothetical protein